MDKNISYLSLMENLYLLRNRELDSHPLTGLRNGGGGGTEVTGGENVTLCAVF